MKDTERALQTSLNYNSDFREGEIGSFLENPPLVPELRQQVLDRLSFADFRQYREFLVTLSDLMESIEVKLKRKKFRAFAQTLRENGTPVGVVGVKRKPWGTMGRVYVLFPQDAQELTSPEKIVLVQKIKYAVTRPQGTHRVKV